MPIWSTAPTSGDPALAGRVTTAESNITSLQSAATSISGMLTAVQQSDVSQDAKNTSQDNAIAALQASGLDFGTILILGGTR